MAKSGGKGLWTKIVLFLVLVLIAAGIAAYWLAPNMEQKDIDQLRANLPGKSAKLSDGYTWYQWAGPPDGPPVVMVHGFSTPSFIWLKNVGALAKAGFHVLFYDLYGRGRSSRPDVAYDVDLFDRQLDELIKDQGIDKPVNLVGLSMGGAISTIYAAKRPDKVASLSLVDPAGYPVVVPFTGKLVRVPGLGEYLMTVIGDTTLVQGAGKSLYNKDMVPEMRQMFKDQMQYYGFKRAILRTLRDYDFSNQAWAFEAVGKTKIPVLLFWGEEDQVIPYDRSEKVRSAIPQTKFVSVAGAGHIPQYEKPDVVNPALIAFIEEAEKR